MKQIPFFIAMILLGGVALADSLEPAWQEMLRMNPSAAYEIFRKVPDSREARLGEAICLLNLQPKTGANIDRANEFFEKVRQGGPDDEPGITALYYEARLAHVHRPEPDLALAARLYGELISRHPEHPLAQMAVVKLAILRIYGQPPAKGGMDALLKDVAASGEHLSDPSAVRDFHLVMADAWALSNGPLDQSLEHLLAAYNTGKITGGVAADVLVRIGELARLLGRKEMAVEFYGKFLKEYPRDERASTIRQRLGGLS